MFSIRSLLCCSSSQTPQNNETQNQPNEFVAVKVRQKNSSNLTAAVPERKLSVENNTEGGAPHIEQLSSVFNNIGLTNSSGTIVGTEPKSSSHLPAINAEHLHRKERDNLRIYRFSDPDFISKLLDENGRSTLPNCQLISTVSEIINEVRTKGDSAVLELNEKFGGAKLTAPTQLKITNAEIEAAISSLDQETQIALNESYQNVREFALNSLRKDWQMENRQGAIVGERFQPYERVGIYVPGGSAPLVSTAIMTCTLAAVAGVPQIVVVTPASKENKISPVLLGALQLAGATEIYKIGGAQGIAALAYGTDQINRVLKIFGPGNQYVVEAKRQVFGTVAIDLLPGPSEILILADETANAAWIAADMLAQAEHGPDSVIGLITISENLISEVQKEIGVQSKSLQRKSQLTAVLENGFSFGCLVKDLNQGIEIVNKFAPEHLSVVATNGDEIAQHIRNAGAIFIGEYSPVVVGDFLAGPSHTLPTTGAGKSFSGLTVDQFQRRTSIIKLNTDSLKQSLGPIKTFSKIEGLDAHGRSATVRFES